MNISIACTARDSVVWRGGVVLIITGKFVSKMHSQLLQINIIINGGIRHIVRYYKVTYIISFERNTVQREICAEENIHDFHILLTIREHFLADLLVFA